MTRALKTVVKSVRLPEWVMERVKRMSQRAGEDDSFILRQAILAGLPKIEDGEHNPFGGIRIAEESPSYGVSALPEPQRKKRSMPAPATSASENTISKKKKIRKH